MSKEEDNTNNFDKFMDAILLKEEKENSKLLKESVKDDPRRKLNKLYTERPLNSIYYK